MTLPNSSQAVLMRREFLSRVAELLDSSALDVADLVMANEILGLLEKVLANARSAAAHLSIAEKSALAHTMLQQYFESCAQHAAARVVAARKERLSERPTMALEEWFDEHRSSPYPSAIERQELSRQSGLSDQQVKTWFVNKRARSKVGRS